MSERNHNDGALLETRSLTMQFGGLTALSSVDLAIARGQVFGLIGPNGAGKTTFFNMLTGIYRPTEGEILMNGTSMVGKTPAQIARAGAVRTFQACRLWDNMSILENLLLGTYLRPRPGLFDTLFRFGRVKADFAEKAEEALEAVRRFDEGLALDHDRMVGELSLVDRRRVEISRAILARPVLLLLDEPAAGMDPSETRQLMDDIAKIQGDFPSMSVLLIEHDMTVIAGMAERVAILNFGEKIAEGSFDEIKNNRDVVAAYLGGSDAA